MKRNMTWGFLLVPILLLLGAGCLFSPDKGGDDEDVVDVYLPNTSIANVLANLITAYEDRNFGEYEKLFDQELFTFEVSEIDIGGPEPLPLFWGWPVERSSADNMFASEEVLSIELDFTFPTPRPVEEADGVDEFDVDMMTFLTTLELIITADNPEDPNDQNTFIVEGDRHEFFFKEYPDETIEGEPVWRIVLWRDQALPPGEGLLAARN